MAVPINMPPLPPFESLKDLTHSELFEAWQKWDAEFVRMNPGYFHADGSQRTLLNRIFGKRRE